MHDVLIEHQAELGPKDLIRYAAQIGLDVKSFTEDLRAAAGANALRPTSRAPT